VTTNAKEQKRGRKNRVKETTLMAMWWVQGFAHEEDIAFNKLVADYPPGHRAGGVHRFGLLSYGSWLNCRGCSWPRR
jgi:hypothetical protein